MTITTLKNEVHDPVPQDIVPRWQFYWEELDIKVRPSHSSRVNVQHARLSVTVALILETPLHEFSTSFRIYKVQVYSLFISSNPLTKPLMSALFLKSPCRTLRFFYRVKIKLHETEKKDLMSKNLKNTIIYLSAGTWSQDRGTSTRI